MLVERKHVVHRFPHRQWLILLCSPSLSPTWLHATGHNELALPQELHVAWGGAVYPP